VQRSGDGPAGQLGVARLRRGQRALGVDGDEGPEFSVEPFDAPEARSDRLDRRDAAIPDRRRQLPERPVDQEPLGAAITASAMVVSMRSS
jgi:hypothetical protein